MRISLFFILIVLSTHSCTVRSFQQTLDKGDDYLIFGNGGGFAGTYKSYGLDKSGRIYKNENEVWKYEGKIPANSVEQSFQNIVQLGLLEKPQNSPGNRYYTLEYNREGKYQKWVWGNNPESDTSLQLMYDILQALISRK